MQVDNLPYKDDFTVQHYEQIVALAKSKWPVVDYHSIPFGKRFLLWRHDCDYSLNRALKLAHIEAAAGLKATYFINPHCEFYNIFERTQKDIILQIQRLGHEVGLHYDSMFFDTSDEDTLVANLKSDAELIETLLGWKPKVFSFHNPTPFLLTCEAERYAGMVNCYSKRLKTKAGYCSDSNGYWRHRRLLDVINSHKSRGLQVLTHPAWWQDRPMTPRHRVFRCVYGRATATIRFFDKAIEAGKRENPGYFRHELAFLRTDDQSVSDLMDYLFHSEKYLELFLMLVSTLSDIKKKTCKAATQKRSDVRKRKIAKQPPAWWSEHAINVLFNSGKPTKKDCLRLLNIIERIRNSKKNRNGRKPSRTTCVGLRKTNLQSRD